MHKSTDSTDEVVCPYCYFEHTESWEWFQGPTNVNRTLKCENCNKEFKASDDWYVIYTTEKME